MTMDELMKSWGNFLTLYTSNSVFRHNMEFLSRMSLEEFGQNIACDAVRNTADLYNRGELGEEVWQPSILSMEETLDSILENPRSFCRVGDGETLIMKGMSIPFQKYDHVLAEKLIEILRSNRRDCLVGIPRLFYTWPKDCTDFSRDWLLKSRMFHLNFWEANLNRERQYIDACFTVLYMSNKDGNIEAMQEHYEKKLRLFEGKKMVIFVGANILSEVKYSVFARAKEVEFVNCPKENAFAVYGQILEKARSYPKDEVVLGL